VAAGLAVLAGQWAIGQLPIAYLAALGALPVSFGAHQAAGLALANTMSSVFNVGLLLYALRRKLGRLELGEIRRHLGALLGAAVLATLVLCFGLACWGYDPQRGFGALARRPGPAA